MQHGLVCTRLECALTVLDSESAQLKWQLETQEQGPPSIPDIAHICKSMRNAVVNNFILVQDELVNTRQLLPFSACPTALLPSDKTSHKQLEQFLSLEVPTGAYSVFQMYPIPIGKEKPAPVFSTICGFVATIGIDVIATANQLHIAERRTSPTIKVVQGLTDVDDLCLFHDNRHCLVLERGGRIVCLDICKRATVVMATTEPHPGFIPRRICVNDETLTSGVMANAENYCKFKLRNNTVLEVEPLHTAHGLRDVAINSAHIWLGTKTGLLRVDTTDPRESVSYHDGHDILAVESNTLSTVFATTAGIFRVQDDSVVQLIQKRLPVGVALSLLRRSIFAAHHQKVYLISALEPHRDYIAGVRKLYKAGGFYSRREGEDVMLEEAVQLVDSVVVWFQGEAERQRSACRDTPALLSRQGPGGFFSTTLMKRLHLLQHGLRRLLQQTAGVTRVCARTCQEDVVESVFSLLLRNYSVAPSVMEVATRLPKLAQLMQLRLLRGASKLFTFSRSDRAYQGLQYGSGRRIDVELEFPTKAPCEHTAEREQFMELQRRLGGPTRTGRIRGLSLAPLSTNPPIHYRTYAELQDQTRQQSTESSSTAGPPSPIFPAFCFVAVRAHNGKIWIAQLGAHIRVLDEEVPVTWLERDGTGWQYGNCQVIPAACVICDVTKFVTENPLDVRQEGIELATTLMRQMADQRKTESKAQENTRPAYRTTRADRAARSKATRQLQS